MKNQKKLSFIMFLISGLMLVVLTVYAVGRETGYFDTRDEASGTTIEVKNEYLRNGENLFMSVEISDITAAPKVWMCLEQGPPPTCPGCTSCLEESVVNVDDNSNIFPPSAYHIFEKLSVGSNVENDGYRVKACGCNPSGDGCNIDNTNKCVSEVVTSNTYLIEEPVGQLESFDDDRFCDYGEVYTGVVHTNREYFNIKIDDSHGDVVYDSDYHAGAFCEGPKGESVIGFNKFINRVHACGITPFEPNEGETYTAKLWWCRDMETDRFADCSTLLDTRNYTAPVCSNNGRDVAIKGLSVPDQINDSENIPLTITVKNRSSSNSGRLRVTAKLGTNPNCFECSSLEDKIYTISNLSAGSENRREVTFSSKEANLYAINVKVETLETNDIKTSNNESYIAFNVEQSGGNNTCDPCPNDQVSLPDCTCVECTSDNDCSGVRKCDLDNNKCVCDNSFCPEGKILTNNCTVCSCADGCKNDEWQDDNCICHSNSCNKECGDKEILTSDCKCQEVDCVNDSDCGGLKTCSSLSNKCVCDVDCGNGMIASDDCEKCLCKIKCDENEVQRSDCTCVSAQEQLVTDPQKVEVSINSDAVKSGEIITDPNQKIILRYELGGNSDVDPKNIVWKIDDEIIGEGNNISYISETSGEFEIELYYDDIKKDTIHMTVLGQSEDAGEAAKAKRSGLKGIVLYFVMGTIVISLAALLVLGVKKFYKKQGMKKRGDQSKSRNTSTPRT